MGYHAARVLQFAAHTFDVAVMDIFTTLTFGGCICIPNEDERRDDLPTFMNRTRVELAILMPQLARTIEPSEVPSLRVLATGGEPLPKDCLQRWADKAVFIQIYGPAEVGICLLTQMRHSSRPETVGYPLSNCACWLVDPDDPHRLVPIGAVGELVVAGPSLARCYLKSPESTRASFLEGLDWANALAPGYTRFYKTGDLLRYNTDRMDGSFDFVTRKDTQIKLRGQRIEPAEVEHSLDLMPEISISVVHRPEKGVFAGELVAMIKMKQPYIVDQNTSTLFVDHENLVLIPDSSSMIFKQHLMDRLPSYMVPVAFLQIVNLPFMSSHKMDRKRLKSWLEDFCQRQHNGAKDTSSHLSLLSPAESTTLELGQKIAEIVASNDKVKQRQLENTDFEIWKVGMNSIHIMSLAFFVRRRYDMKMSMRVLLTSSLTVRDIARIIDNPDGSSALMQEPVDLMARCLSATQLLISETTVDSVVPGFEKRAFQHVFLTGATGYLGIVILQHLLRTSDAVVSMLVRCTDDSAGLKLLVEVVAKLDWWRSSYVTRIQVWRGDLELPNLGLSQIHLQQLAGESSATESCHPSDAPPYSFIDTVIHNGARVHYSSSYETLEKVNVQSTIHLLRLTAKSSSISNFVFVSGGRKPNARIQDAADFVKVAAELQAAGGYAQTKFVSEQIVRSCARHSCFQGRRLLTVQPGYIIGDRTDGTANTNDFIWRLIAGCVEVHAYNNDERDKWLYMADVDCVASSIVRMAQSDTQSSGHSECVGEGLHFTQLWDLLRSEFGYELEGLPHGEWLSRMKDCVTAKNEEHLLFPLLDVLEREGASLGDEVVPSELDGSLVTESIKANVRYLIAIGFLPASPKSR